VWGIALILSSGIASLAFVVLYWDEAKSPFCTSLLGSALLIGGLFFL
jgi:hypothetical protein